MIVSLPDLELATAWQQYVDRHGRHRDRLDALLARHREPHRRYHTAVHVMWVVRHVHELAAAEPVDRLDQVVAAALYHDAIYDPTRADNEHVSAELARRDLASFGWAPEAVDRVASMIEATAHGAAADHEPVSSVDTAVLLDADLAILGADPATYDAYVRGVRVEYGHVDDAAWCAGRAAVLASFTARTAIYVTATGRTRWGDRARANLAAELATLT